MDEDDDDDAEYDDRDYGEDIMDIGPMDRETAYADLDGPTAQDIESRRRKQDMFQKLVSNHKVIQPYSNP